MTNTIIVGDKAVPFKATAAVPRLYRIKFHRDILQDLAKLKTAYERVSGEEQEQFTAVDLEMFENVAYIMAKHADQSVPNTIEEWLDQYEMFSIYEVLPEILELWALNEQTSVESKKKFHAQIVK